MASSGASAECPPAVRTHSVLEIRGSGFSTPRRLLRTGEALNYSFSWYTGKSCYFCSDFCGEQGFECLQWSDALISVAFRM
jgi:hypothetical protein